MAKKARCPPKKKRRRGGKKTSRWLAHVKAEYRKNKSGGLAAAMRRAKKSYRR